MAISAGPAAHASGPTPADGAIALPCSWPQPVTLNYRMENRVTAPNGKVVSSATAPVSVTPVSGGHAPEWRYDLGTAKNTLREDAPIAGPVPADGDHIEVRVRRSASGDVELTGPDAVRGYLGGRMQPIRDVYGEAGDLLSERALRDLRPFFDEHCRRMVPGQTVRQPRDLHTRRGPIAGMRIVELASHDAAARTVTFRSTTRVDGDVDAARRALEQQGGPPADDQARRRTARLAEMAANTTVRTTATYSLDDGFPTRLEVVRRSGADDDPRALTESWVWTRGD